VGVARYGAGGGAAIEPRAHHAGNDELAWIDVLFRAGVREGAAVASAQPLI